MTEAATLLDEALLERELRAIFASPKFDLEQETQKTIRKKITQRLELDEFPSDQKELLKQLVKRLIDEQNESEEDSEDEENNKPPKPKRLKKKTAPKNKSSSSPYSSSVQTLINLGTAMRLGPRLHHGLKAMGTDEERMYALTDRLKEAGASWKGKLPSPQDIAKAKAAKQRQDDLDGLDTSLILDGTRRRRGRAVVSYAMGNQDDDDDEEEQDDDEEEERPRKKKAKKLEMSSDEHSKSDGFDGNSSSDAESD